MSYLEISEAKAKKINEVEADAIDLIGDVIKGIEKWDEKSSAAMKFLGVAAKNRQTLTARLSLGFNMACQIANDPKQLAKYVKATHPEIRKALKSG